VSSETSAPSGLADDVIGMCAGTWWPRPGRCQRNDSVTRGEMVAFRVSFHPRRVMSSWTGSDRVAAARPRMDVTQGFRRCDRSTSARTRPLTEWRAPPRGSASPARTLAFRAGKSQRQWPAVGLPIHGFWGLFVDHPLEELDLLASVCRR